SAAAYTASTISAGISPNSHCSGRRATHPRPRSRYPTPLNRSLTTPGPPATGACGRPAGTNASPTPPNPSAATRSECPEPPNAAPVPAGGSDGWRGVERVLACGDAVHLRRGDDRPVLLPAPGRGRGGGGLHEHGGGRLARVPEGVRLGVPLHRGRKPRVPRGQGVHRDVHADRGHGRGDPPDQVHPVRAQAAGAPARPG